ncbi:hypothetical protein [Streptomyces sp. CA-111067]|uniref:hypothetical protein n=1 Tax=Streptomyces sp. CA-111067 TaxID=3240046 RepID=UPI003D9655D0
MTRKTKRQDWTPPAVAEPAAWPAAARPAVAARTPGRGLLAVALVLSALCFGMFFALRADCGSTVDALRAHGAQKVAFVSRTGTDKFGELTHVDVTFENAAGSHRGTLCVPAGGSLPKGVTTGSAVAVVYDTRRPSRVMLAAQVAHPPGWSLSTVLSLAGGVLFLGLGAGVFVRRRMMMRGR